MRRPVALAVLVLALAAWFAVGWVYVTPDGYGIRESTWLKLAPRRLEPGWHWLPRPFLTARRLPRGEQRHSFRIGFESRLDSPEGAAWAAAGELVWQVEEAALTRLAAQAGEGVSGSVIDPALVDAGRRLLAKGHGGDAISSMEEFLRSDLGPRLAAVGVSLVSVSLDAVGSPEAVRARLGQRQAGRRPPGSVLLVGWDGADWNLLDPLLEQGRMPNLSRLLARGSRSRLRTVTPVLSPVVWTSVATGSLPEKHGIIDFLAVDQRSGARVPVTSNLRRVPALWTLLERRALPVGIVAWWATWPAEPVRGYMVTDRLAYQLFGMGESLPETPEGKTWPPDLYSRIASLVVRPDQISDTEVEAFAPGVADGRRLTEEDVGLLEEFKTVLAATRTYHRVALELAQLDTPVLRAVYYEATDTASHLFMPFRPPLMEGIDPRRADLWGGVVDAVYQDLDLRLGELLATTSADTTVILVSDHGFRSDANRPASDARIGGGRAAEWHRKYGVMVVSGPHVKPGATAPEASVLDVAPTVLALLGLPIPAAMDGRVPEEIFDAAFLASYPPLVETALPPPAAATGEGPTAAPVASGADGAIMERLRTLGYIGEADVEGLAQSEVTAYNNRAAILLADGRAEEALVELDRGLALAPVAVPLRVNRARALRSLDREAEALELLRGVLQEDPSQVMVANIMANIYMEKGELTEAGRLLDSALERDPHAVDLLISRGLLDERLGLPDKAMAAYRRAVEIDPDSAEAHNNMGNLSRSHALQARAGGDEAAADRSFREAEAAYRAGLEADPDFIGTYNNLALILQDTGRNEDAMALYRRALERSPEHAVVLNNLGSLYFAAGRLQEARDAFQRAVAADPEYASAHNNLGATLGRLGLPEQELAAYRRAVDLDPGYADGHHNLGLALLARGDQEGGEQELLRALALRPDYLSACTSLAELYLRQSRAGEALPLLRRALAVNSGVATFHNLMGEALWQRGDAGPAAESWRRSLQIMPEQPDVRRRLEMAQAAADEARRP